MNKYTNLLAIILVAAFISSTTFVCLPDCVNSFELINPNSINQLRYLYKGTINGLVYGIFNTETGMIYVGSTSNPVVRFYEHLVSGDNSNLYLQNAISKYGLNVFVVYIFVVVNVDVVMTKRDLLDLEQKYLDYFPEEQKYNFAKLAGGGGRPMTDAQRLAVSKRMKGINIGRAPINKGVSLSSAAKAMLLKANAHRKHAVYIYDDMLNLVAVYPSISQAVKAEKAQKNSFIKYLNDGQVWRGYIITKSPLR